MEGLAGSLFSLRGAAIAAAAALGFLATAALANASQAAADFETEMVELQKVTDAQTMRQMGDAISDMAQKIPRTQEELANIASVAGRLGIDGAGNIRQFTRVVAEMGIATDIAGEEAARGLAKMVKQTDATIQDVRGIGAAINELSNNVAASTSEIVNAAGRSAASLSLIGVSTDDILALNAAVTEMGISARRAGSKLRRVAQELEEVEKLRRFAEATGATTQEIVKMREQNPVKLILSLARAMKEGGKEARAIAEVFSTQTRQSLAFLGKQLGNIEEMFGISANQFENFGSLSREAGIAMDTMNSQLQITRNVLHQIAIDSGEFLNKALLPLVRALNKGLKGFQGLNEATDGALGAILGMTTAVAGLTFVIHSILTLIGSGGDFVSGLATIGTKLRNLGGFVKETATAVAAFGGRVNAALRGIIPAITSVSLSFSSISSAVSSVGGVVSGVLSGIGSAIGALASPIGIVLAIVTALGAAWVTNFGQIQDIVGNATDRLGRQFADLKDEIDETAEALEPVAEFIETRVVPAFDKLAKATETTFSAIVASTVAVIETILGSIMSVLKFSLNIIQGDFEEAFNGVGRGIVETLQNLIPFMKEWGAAMAQNAIAGALGIVADAPPGIAQALFGIKRQQAEVAQAAIETKLGGTGEGALPVELRPTDESIKLADKELRDAARKQAKAGDKFSQVATDLFEGEAKAPRQLISVLKQISKNTGTTPTEAELRRAIRDGTVGPTEMQNLFGRDVSRQQVVSALRSISQKPGLHLSNEELKKIVRDNQITNSELRKWLPQIALNTSKTSSTLGSSDVIQGDPCDLRDFLLGPFERVPRQRAPRAGQTVPGAGKTSTITPAGIEAAQKQGEAGRMKSDPGKKVQDNVKKGAEEGAMEGVLRAFAEEQPITSQVNLDGKKVSEDLSTLKGRHNTSRFGFGL